MYGSTLGGRGFMSWPSFNVCRISLCREFRDGACRFYLLFEQHGPRIARAINAAFEATKTCVSPMRHKPLFRYTESLLLGVMSIAATFISGHLFHETGGWEDPNKLKQHSTKASLESHVLQSTILTPTPYLCFFFFYGGICWASLGWTARPSSTFLGDIHRQRQAFFIRSLMRGLVFASTPFWRRSTTYFWVNPTSSTRLWKTLDGWIHRLVSGQKEKTVIDQILIRLVD